MPLAGAQITGGQVRVPFDKALIKGSPHHDTGEPLSFAEQAHLYRHYALALAGDGSKDSDGLPDTVGASSAPADDATATRRGTRSPAAARKGQSPVDLPRLRKYVVTETQTVTVPVTHEVPVVKRTPVSDSNRDQFPDAGQLGAQEVAVVLHEDRLIVQVDTVPVERVRIINEPGGSEEVNRGQGRVGDG